MASGEEKESDLESMIRERKCGKSDVEGIILASGFLWSKYRGRPSKGSQKRPGIKDEKKNEGHRSSFRDFGRMRSKRGDGSGKETGYVRLRQRNEFLYFTGRRKLKKIRKKKGTAGGVSGGRGRTVRRGPAGSLKRLSPERLGIAEPPDDWASKDEARRA